MENTINMKPKFIIFLKLFLLCSLASGLNYFNSGTAFSQTNNNESSAGNPLLTNLLKADLREIFINPPLSYKSRPLWFWNKPLSVEQTRKVLIDAKRSGYYGLGIVPSYGMTPEFMTPEYLDQYKAAVEIAYSLGMKLYLYDEFYFPSGMAGGMLAKQYPEAVSKRLDMELFEVKGNEAFEHKSPIRQKMAS
jgi:hypothetical protein